MNATFKKYSGMAKDLNTGEPINWGNLETIWAFKGKDHVLDMLDKEKKGANNVYLCHLSLAEQCILELNTIDPLL